MILSLFVTAFYENFPYLSQYFIHPYLSQLLKGVTIASGGVLPRIHPELLTKKASAKLNAATAQPLNQFQIKKTIAKKDLAKVRVLVSLEFVRATKYLEFVRDGEVLGNQIGAAYMKRDT